MFIRQETLELIEAVRSKYRVIFLTDNMDCFDRFTIPALNLESYFDQIINSYNHGVTKADANGGLFKCINIKDFKNTAFIDNSEKNCQLFDELGGKSYLVEIPTDIDTVLKKLL